MLENLYPLAIQPVSQSRGLNVLYNRTREVLSARPISLIVVLITLTIPFLWFSYDSVRIFQPKFISEFEAKSQIAATGLQRQIGRAVSAFGGMDALREVEPVLDQVRSLMPGFAFLVLTDQGGNVLYASADDRSTVRGSLPIGAVADSCTTGVFSPGTMKEANQSVDRILVTGFPICSKNRQVGILYAGISIGKLDALKWDLRVDTSVVMIAIILFIMELLILIFAIFLIRPVWAIDFLTARLRDRDLRFTIHNRRAARRGIIRQINGIISRTAGSLKSSAKLRLPGPGGTHALRIPAVNHIRLPLFLFFLSEALLRPILPQFLREFTLPNDDPHFRIGILMSGFMVASLFSVFLGSILSGRCHGPRRVFFWGAICAGFGMFGHYIAGHSIAGDWTWIFFLRVLTGFGYGLVYAAAQVYIAQHADPVRRTTGFSIFLAVIVAAEICGPAIGGILADRFGDLQVVLTATLVIVLSTVLCLLLLPRFPPDITDPNAVPEENRLAVDKLRDQSVDGWRLQYRVIKDVSTNTRFILLLFCFAIPAKALLTGGLFLLIPLTVFSGGGEAAESARVLMAYGIAILLLLPALAPLADRWQGFFVWVATGGMVAGVGFVLPNAWNVFGGEGLTVLFVSTLVFGLGQTLSIPTQVNFVLRVADPQVTQFGVGPVLGLYRLIERLGSFAGPLIAGALLIEYPPEAALMWMGLGAMLLAAIGLSWFLAFGEKNENEAIEALLANPDSG